MTETTKARNFFSLPLSSSRDLKECIPGIGDSGVEKLNSNGIENVWQLVGKFLMLDCNKKKFALFLEDCGIRGNNRVNANDIAEVIAMKVDILMKN